MSAAPRPRRPGTLLAGLGVLGAIACCAALPLVGAAGVGVLGALGAGIGGAVGLVVGLLGLAAAGCQCQATDVVQAGSGQVTSDVSAQGISVPASDPGRAGTGDVRRGR